MILFELTNNEQHPVYQRLEVENGGRQYSFMQSMAEASLAMGRPFLSQTIIKALNFHAIGCLHVSAGEYRPCQVFIGTHIPPEHYRVQALMDDFVNMVNRHWETADPLYLASFVLWKICFIHPFINGNGRTARAACYYVLCTKIGGLVPGTIILPELLKQNRPDYEAALRHADATFQQGTLDLSQVHALLSNLLAQQLATAPAAAQGAP